MARVNAAYAVLDSPRARRSYDYDLRFGRFDGARRRTTEADWCCASCAFFVCKKELIDLLLSRGSPPAESAQKPGSCSDARLGLRQRRYYARLDGSGKPKNRSHRGAGCAESDGRCGLLGASNVFILRASASLNPSDSHPRRPQPETLLALISNQKEIQSRFHATTARTRPLQASDGSHTFQSAIMAL